MSFAALIVAAGKSSRMGSFKPMLNLGSISIAQRVVANFRQAGIRKIVMVTGYNAGELEHHLAGLNIVFLRNDNYETTQMFDSVKIGLEYLKSKADTIFFTPVDVPLFTSGTVSKMAEINAPIMIPVCCGTQGHPIALGSHLIDSILSDSGERGLRGAIEACGESITYVDVEDAGTIHDADTPAEYEELLRLHNNNLIRCTLNIRLEKEKPFFDEKIFTLLTLINETGSVREASSRMHISYTTCWNIIKNLESQLQNPLVYRIQGGRTGSHSQLTDYGKMLIERYSLFSDKLHRYSEEIFDEFFGELF